MVTPDDLIRYEEGKSVPRIQMDILYEEIRNQLPALGGLSAEQKPIHIRLPVYDKQPETTIATLKNQGIERKIMEYSTTFNDQAEGRLHNVRSTASVLNEQLLKPGEVFDYAKMIELAEKQYGFKEAPVIVNGKLVPGVGGGICQVSTTLYNAILRTGLEVVERRNHSLPISYAPLGQDATFSSGHINFKFRNNTGSHLLIITQTSTNGLTVKLFGKIPPNISYDIISKTVETLPPTIKYVHNPALKDGQQKTIQSGRPGYIVETYRYKKQDGKVIATEKISRDRYSPQPTIISSNQEKSRPDLPTKVLLKGLL
ncbi:VanW family protein [Paenibacillus larvae]|uniref:VanW family protein n=1 Tax=Paenibacillus larvae TaxID=1464 RepID=UPI00288CDA4A|nr:VanW family protein [Paenibacillus larvae]MDT2192592.1 VanW family protein [Paenibacillus larvae]MDT2235825.1 VanW family protein [Paenibacillus larvae]MDT2239884.1 VanW family protein [Paenibacillus larvae]MDT2246522.1 VanW family protein [Paenibacillus larvae]MDT2256728.1 VanW family protein [Paenibacillus larvae]